MSSAGRCAAFALFLAWSAKPAWAQTPAAPAQAPPAAAAGADDEEAFEEKLREFGYWYGAAFGCAPQAKQAEVERQVLDAYHSIARLFGTDRAFFYAAAFGHGTSVKIEGQKCPDFPEKFQKATALRGGK